MFHTELPATAKTTDFENLACSDDLLPKAYKVAKPNSLMPISQLYRTGNIRNSKVYGILRLQRIDVRLAIWTGCNRDLWEGRALLSSPKVYGAPGSKVVMSIVQVQRTARTYLV